MKKAVAVFFVFVLAFASSLSFAQTAATQAPKTAPETLPVDQIKAGMRGVAYTVFEGVKPEPMDVEVLGVLRDVNGPKGDIILARLHGQKVEYTGVVAGMSGSPVYIGGKLVGALAFRIGSFSKEPIAGITPIADMFEINELDRSVPKDVAPIMAKERNEASRTSTGAGPQDLNATQAGGLQQYRNFLQPIEAPLVFSGFTEDTLQRFGPQFAAAGVTPVMGVGGSSGDKQPEPIEPGSAVSAQLVRGDMDISATCTVTYADAERLLACGHPLLNYGMVDLPMTKAEVLATLASPLNAFKIVNTTEPIGTFVQDRHTGIMGRYGQESKMIPVTLTIHGGPRPKQFKYEVLNNARLTPVAMMATVYNALSGINEYGEEITFRMQGKITVGGYPDVGLQNMFAPADVNMPTGFLVALNVGERFGRIFDNAYSKPNISGVQLDFDVVRERKSARLESARTDLTEARPGDEVIIEAVLRPYRGEPIVRQIPVRIPTSTPKGTLRILVSDGDTLDRMRRMSPAFGSKLDLGSVIALLNKEHANHRLYVSLMEANPQAMVEDKVMPTLPLSVMNVMEGMRGRQEMIVTGESAVDESSTPLDYVVSGAQLITVTVK